MGVTAIKRLVNETNRTIRMQCLENRGWDSNNAYALPGKSDTCNMWIPWCIGSDQWWKHHIWLAWTLAPGTPQYKFFYIWQNGDFVRSTTDHRWKSADHRIPGESGVNGDRILVVKSLDPIRVEMHIHWG